MARSTKKSTTQEIAEALNTPVNLNWCDVAEELGVTIPDLQERFATKLNDATVFTWDTIPVEHQGVIDAIARDLDAERSTRKLEPQAETPQLPETTEPPLLEEKPQSKRKGKKSSALTQRKSSGLKNSDQNSQQMASTDLQVKEVLHARKGQKSGARLATIELLAEDSTYRKIKGEGLVRKVAQLTQELSAEADFDPIATLQELGIDANSDLYEDLRQQIEPALGKVESATAEIVETAWVNGIDLDVSHLESLLNSNEY